MLSLKLNVFFVYFNAYLKLLSLFKNLHVCDKKLIKPIMLK